MTLVRIDLDDGSNNEWGMRVNVVPAIGDTLWLYYEIPGEERTGNYHLEATVVNRRFAIDDDEQEVWLTASCTETVPEGFIADSPEWPSDDLNAYTVKKALGKA